MLSIRKYHAENNEGSQPLGYSLDCGDTRNAQGKSHKDSTESRKVAVIRIIGPSGEEKESFRITSNGELQCADESIPRSAGPTSRPNNLENIQTEVEDGKRNGRAENKENIAEMDSNNESANIYSNNSNTSNKEEDFICGGESSSKREIFKQETSMIAEQLAAAAVREAVREISQYSDWQTEEGGLEKNMNKIKGNDNQKKHECSKYSCYANSKLHDFAYDIMTRILQQSWDEVAVRMKRKLGVEMTDWSVKVDAIDTANICIDMTECRQYKPGGPSGIENSKMHDDNNVSADTNGEIVYSRSSAMHNNMITERCAAYASVANNIKNRDEDNRIENDVELTENSGHVDQAKQYNSRATKDSGAFDQKADQAIPLLINFNDKGYLTKDCILQQINLKLKTKLEDESDEPCQDLITAAKKLAQDLIMKSLSDAFLDVCENTLHLLDKSKKSSSKISRIATPSQSQCYNSKQNFKDLKKKKTFKRVNPEDNSACLNISFTDHNSQLETVIDRDDESNHVAKAAVQSKKQQNMSDFAKIVCYANEISRAIIISAVVFTKVTRPTFIEDCDA